MGKITDALKKAAEERLHRIDKIARIKEHSQIVAKKIGDSKVDARITTYFDSKSQITEQYKVLRTNILSLDKGKSMKAIAITSSLHSEGKTITSLNLAIALAQAVNKPKILLVDADLRRGRIIKYLGVKQNVGLSEVLQGNVKYDEALFKIDLDNLTLLASGAVPNNPAELLSSEYMSTFLSETRKRFDYILIDTPPIISVTDAGIVGAQTDGALMIIQAGRTQRGIVRHATELLHQAHVPIVGHILTNIEYHLPEYIYRYL